MKSINKKAYLNIVLVCVLVCVLVIGGITITGLVLSRGTVNAVQVQPIAGSESLSIAMESAALENEENQGENEKMPGPKW